MKQLELPISFDEVPYFKNSFRGDLIITTGVIYYFPHANTLKADEGITWHATTDLIGIYGLPIGFLLHGVWRVIRTTVNRSRLRKQGLWMERDTNALLQARLDGHITELRKQPPELVRYDYSLPRPMRFAVNEVKNVTTRRGLRFDTEFDTHDFRIALHRRRLLRDALWLAGFKS